MASLCPAKKSGLVIKSFTKRSIAITRVDTKVAREHIGAISAALKQDGPSVRTLWICGYAALPHAVDPVGARRRVDENHHAGIPKGISQLPGPISVSGSRCFGRSMRRKTPLTG